MQPYYYSSDDVGAPALNNVAGSTLDLLRACGITGYNTRAVVSIVVTSGVAVATILDHGFSATKAQLVRFEGAPLAGLNGDVQPTAVSTNTLTYAAPTVADGTYTGTISAKRAPFGLTEVFTGTNKAVFGRASPEAAAALLRMDDAGVVAFGAVDCRALSVESATDVDTYTGESPLNADIPGGWYWRKGANDASAKRWFLVGCEKGFYLFTQGSSASNMVMQEWIDIDSIWPADAYNTVISGTAASTGAANSIDNLSLRAMVMASTVVPAPGAPRVQRPAIGIGGAQVTALVAPYNNDDLGSVGAADLSYVPILRPIPLLSGTGVGHQMRGTMPGLAAPLAALPYANGQIVGTQDGSQYLSVRVTGNSSNGNVLVSLNPDW